MLKLQEPMWGENFLKLMNGWMAKHDLTMQLVPILADVFVLAYPVYLVALYVYGINKKKTYYKDASLMLFFAGFGSMFVNVIIQTFVTKARPDVVLELFVENRDALVLESLPKDTFPSDHAAMAAAIATVTLMWGLRHKDKTFIMFSLPLILFAILMGFGRITVGIHWPTDILVGTIVGIIVSLLVFEKHIFAWLRKHVFTWIIQFQEWIWEKIFGVRK